MTTTPDRRQLITSFYGNVIAFLHVHHHGEEALVFPLLRERCAGQLELIDAVAAQHRDVDELVAAVGRIARGVVGRRRHGQGSLCADPRSLGRDAWRSTSTTRSSTCFRSVPRA